MIKYRDNPTFSRERGVLSTNSNGTFGHSYAKKKTLNPYILPPDTKVHSKWTINPNVKGITIKRRKIFMNLS